MLLRLFSPSPSVRAPSTSRDAGPPSRKPLPVSSLAQIGDLGATRVDKWSNLFKSSDDSTEKKEKDSKEGERGSASRLVNLGKVKEWETASNTADERKTQPSMSQPGAVLHYTYPKFSDLTSRRDRCGCKPTKVDVKRCFMLEFDRAAFIIASTASSEEMLQWYREHVVWTDKKLKLKLLRKGILTRIYAPMVIIQELREAGVVSSVVTTAHMSFSKNSSTADSTLRISREHGEHGSSFFIDGA